MGAAVPGNGDHAFFTAGSQDVIGEDQSAAVEIYNMEGQPVYSNHDVTPDTEFWTGDNRLGDAVTTGLYLVRITWQGNSTVETLAVVR